jgi:DNA polymerase-3 subunit delta
MAKTTKSSALHALDYLNDPQKHPPKSVCAVFGDDTFLKGEVLLTLRRAALGKGDAELGLSEFSGDVAQMRDVRDALSSLSLFGDGACMVIVGAADDFVTEHRTELEDYAAAPARGVLVLDVESWPSNTRLAKAVAATGLTISCSAPPERQIKTWLIKYAKNTCGVTLDAAAVDTLMELVPPELGILVQEVTKLALMAGADQSINVKMVSENVGGWKTRAVWDMIDAAADGRAAVALAQLDRLITSGEKPHGLLPQMASNLRRFATALTLIEASESERRRITARDALAQAGVPPFKLTDADRQFRQIGRRRARHLVERLLAADLAIKGHNSADDRARNEIERLIVQLSSNALRTAAAATQ